MGKKRVSVKYIVEVLEWKNDNIIHSVRIYEETVPDKYLKKIIKKQKNEKE